MAYNTLITHHDSSSILTDNGQPFVLPLPQTVLDQLPSYTYAKSLIDNDIDYFVSLDELLKHNIISQNDGYFYNDKPLTLTAFRELANTLNNNNLAMASRAIQALKWADMHRFCGKCANPLSTHESEYAKCCTACKTRFYPKIQPCVIVAIIKDNQILLAQHHRHKDGMYGLIAGFIEMGETAEQAVSREVGEEVGLGVRNIRYLASQSWAYPSNLMLGFVADYDSGTIGIDDNELTDARFFDLDNLPKIPPQGTIARQLIDYVIKHKNTAL